MINVSVLGYGTVGSGVVEVLKRNQKSIDGRVGEEIRVKSVLDLRDFPGDPIQDSIVHDFSEIENDASVSIVVETMGGLHPAYEFVKASLKAGKTVCTSNKELVAAYGPELLETAKNHNASFLFEASVGGGIPIIRPLNTALQSEQIEEITGILNGTTNYILTKMTDEGSDFDTVLKDAQDKGYAERNPEADVEGYDACRKIAILTSLAYGKTVDYNDIYTEGITKITDRDIAYAKKLNAKVKIFGSSKSVNGKVQAMVAPKMIDAASPLYSVDDVFNAILVKGNTLGDVMFYGKGAGSLPTASAVVSDVIDAAKHIGKNIRTVWADEKLELASMADVESRFFVRVSGDAGANAAKVKELFGDVQTVDAGFADEYAFVTGAVSEKAFADAQQAMGNVVNRIRVDF